MYGFGEIRVAYKVTQEMARKEISPKVTSLLVEISPVSTHRLRVDMSLVVEAASLQMLSG
jgi:hypothetical protein